MKRKLRIGFRHPLPILPNAAVFVISVTEEAGNKLIAWADTGRALLTLEGETTIASRIVCEFRQ